MVAEFDVESFVKEEPEIISEEIRIPVVRSGGLEGIVGVKWAATLNGNYGKRKSLICRRKNNWLCMYGQASLLKQGPAGQRWVLGYFKHIKHIQNIQHIQQCQIWTAPMIFLKKTAHFWNLKKQVTDHPTIRRSDRRTDQRTDGHTLI